MVIDTSAILAILLGEPESPRFIQILAGAQDPVISAATLLEASIVMLAKTGPAGLTDLDALLASAAVRCIAVDEAQARIALDAFDRFGKGRSPSGLNYGDCFTYALAAAMNRSVLFKGMDFAKTDLTPAAT
jgi:ribonuclease VapC